MHRIYVPPEDAPRGLRRSPTTSVQSVQRPQVALPGNLSLLAVTPLQSPLIPHVHAVDEEARSQDGVPPKPFWSTPSSPTRTPPRTLQPSPVQPIARQRLPPPQPTRPTGPPPPLVVDGRGKPDYTAVLFANSSLGISRFFFALLRYPALVLLIVSTWLLWGRGIPSHPIVATDTYSGWRGGEKAGAIMALAAGGYTLFAALSISANHNNSPTQARVLTVLRVLSSLVSGILAGAVIVFAGLVLPKLNKLTAYVAVGENFERGERITVAGVWLGASLLLVLFALLSVIFGVFAVYRLRGAKRAASVAARRGPPAYDNPAMQY